MFFTHNTQYSLLPLIHQQVQCNLTITRNTFFNVCSLNCINLFLNYKIGQTCLMCVCVFWIYEHEIFLVKRCFESLKCCLDLWLYSMLDCIHIRVFLFLKNCFKQSRQLLDTSRHLGYLSSPFSCLLSQSRQLLDPSRNFLDA